LITSKSSRVPWRLSVLTGLLALAGATLGGCYHMAFEQSTPNLAAAGSCPTCDGRSVATAENGLRFKEGHNTFLLGAIGRPRVDTNKYCSQPIRTETKATAGDVALGVVTFGIYTPRHAYVTCPAGQQPPVGAVPGPATSSLR
jgi:hypothetical protein